jgi:hypothetical protein
MACSKLSIFVRTTSDLVNDLRYTQIILDAAFDRFHNFNKAGMSADHFQELENIFYLFTLYESQLSEVLSALSENVDASVRLVQDLDSLDKLL